MKPHRIQEKCNVCGKQAIEDRVEEFFNERIVILKCGHLGVEESIGTKEVEFKDGRRFYPFQAYTHEFAANSNFRCLIANDMGLGKTLNGIAPILTNPELTLPALIFCKSSLTIQWAKQVISATGIIPLVLSTGKDIPLPGFQVYICGLDLARRLDWIKDYDFKYVVIDEVQLIKNPNSKRTQQIQNVVREKEHIVGLSGTPIKNHAAEYYPILNIIKPTFANNYASFVRNWVEIEYKGRFPKAGGLRRDRIDEWNDRTKDFLIRFTREEAMPDLPPIVRDFKLYDLGDEVKELYDREVARFNEEFDGVDETNYAKHSMNILAYFTRMRHLTGLAKINPTVDLAFEFLESVENEKLTIFCHHKKVFDIIEAKLAQVCADNNWESPVSLRAEDPPGKELEFTENPKKRLLIASELSKGEGLDLQACSNTILCERQWNPANEEQAEKRFSRPGSKAKKVFATYVIAEGTIDEYFSELVERKRERVTRTLDGEASPWDESSLMKELFFRIQNSGRSKWA